MQKKLFSIILVLMSTTLFIMNVYAYENDEVVSANLNEEYLMALSNSELNELAAPFRALIESLYYGIPSVTAHCAYDDELARLAIIYMLANMTLEDVYDYVAPQAYAFRIGKVQSAILEEAWESFHYGTISADELTLMHDLVFEHSRSLADITVFRNVYDAQGGLHGVLSNVEHFGALLKNEVNAPIEEFEPLTTTRTRQITQDSTTVFRSVMRLRIMPFVQEANDGSGWGFVRYAPLSNTRYYGVPTVAVLSFRLHTINSITGDNGRRYTVNARFDLRTTLVNITNEPAQYAFILPHPRSTGS